MRETISIVGTALANVSKNTAIHMTMTNGYATLACVGGAICFTGTVVAIYAIASAVKNRTDDR